MPEQKNNALQASNTIINGQLFNNFVNVYAEVYSGKLTINKIAANLADNPLGNTNPWFIATATIDNDLAAAWKNSELADYDFDTACQDIHDLQQRLFNIYNNPNYDVNGIIGSYPHQQFTTVFHTMNVNDIGSSFDVTGINSDTFINPNYQALFNQQIYLEVVDNYGAFSPSSYLVDLDKNTITHLEYDDVQKSIGQRRLDII